MSNVKHLIKRLLATANDESASDNEIEQALRSARQLMFKYHLSEDDIKFTEHERKIENTTSDFSGFGKNISSWESYLAGYIGKFVGCIFVYLENDHKNARRFGKAILVNGLPQEKQHIVFCGPSDLVQLATELYSDLATMIAFMAKCKYGSVFVG